MNSTRAIVAALLGGMLGVCVVAAADRDADSAVPGTAANIVTPTTAREGQKAEESALPEAVISSHRWAARMRPNESVRISNDYGDIRIKSSADSKLIYAGTVQKLNGEQREPEFLTNNIAGGLALGVQTPNDWQGRVDAGVRVPPGARLELRTTNGLIQVRTGSNDIDARSDEGPLQLRTDGKIVASSNAGAIRATFQSKTYPEAAGSLETVSGGIEVWIRPDAVLLISVVGKWINGLPEGVGKVRAGENGATLIEIGNSGAPLSVTSASGTISINAVPLPIASGVSRE